MEEILKTILSAIVAEDIDFSDIKINEDENGLVTLQYQKPNKEFTRYCESMSDELFEASVAAFRQSYPEEFEVIKSQSGNYKEAVAKFKETVHEVAQLQIRQKESNIANLKEKIKCIQDQIKNLSQF